MAIWCAVLGFCAAAAPGCIVVQPIAVNPIPGFSTVAIAPFSNLSQERSVDPRRFAFAYYAELQKVQGFEVVPVGVVEQAMIDHRLTMDRPEDALKLAELLGVDAVVVGSITDYDPYYPPRIGLQVQWYSPYEWNFHPGVPTEPSARHTVRQQQRYRDQQRRRDAHLREVQSPAPQPIVPTDRLLEPRTVRGQSELLSESQDTSAGVIPAPWQVTQVDPELDQPGWPVGLDGDYQRRPDALPKCEAGCGPDGCPQCGGTERHFAGCLNLPDRLPVVREIPPPIDPFPGPPLPRDPRQPLMSYTRLFDGTDPDLTAALRDYVEITGNLRSGGWEGYLHRSEDFIRFTAYLMIQEMLTMHGGQTRRRVFVTHRKFK